MLIFIEKKREKKIKNGKALRTVQTKNYQGRTRMNNKQ